MASFRKPGPYQWQAQVRKKGYPLQTKTFETKAAAEAWACATEHKMDQGVYFSRAEAETTTLGELLKKYRNDITPNKKGADTESIRIGALLRHHLSRRYVATIRGADIARFRDERLKKVCGATVKRDLVIISHLFEVARKEWGIPVLNPVRDIKLPQHGNARTRHLEIGDHEAGTEEERLLQACRNARNPYLLPIVQLALETAMRRSELLSLKWEHIDLDSQIVFLPDTKNGESRTVPLSSIAVSVLRKLPRSKHPDVFRGMTAEAIKRSYMRALRRAEIEDLRFHDLRHEATTRLFEKGLNIMEVASITGHKDLAMLRRYAHLRAEDLAKKLG